MDLNKIRGFHICSLTWECRDVSHNSFKSIMYENFDKIFTCHQVKIFDNFRSKGIFN